jgi:hypothetical protein
MFGRNKTGELVVKPRVSSRTKIIVAAVLGTALVVTAGWIYNYGLSAAGFDRLSADRRLQQLQDEVRRLTGENQELKEGVARAQRTLQMDHTSYQELERSLKGYEQEIVKLREELNFYRNIISPADKKAGLRIQSLSVERMGKPSEFRYKLVLIQALKHDRTVYGRARFEVSGMQDGENAVLQFPLPQERQINVNFRYFQDIEGKIALPKDFQPKQIKVHVTTSGGSESVEQIYAWPQSS